MTTSRYPLEGLYESTGEVRPTKEGELYLWSNFFPAGPRKVVRAMFDRLTPEIIMREIPNDRFPE